MNANTFNIEEFGLKKTESKELILNLLSQQIAHYKKQNLIAWEKNHSLSDEEMKERIAALQEKKNEIEAFFNDCPSCEMDLAISFEVKVKQPALERAYA
ncbi:MAG: hypothetical protein HWE22_19160 [Flavobacteriales bacterium]|nr:hypothetical protein [Flavobacteriales bacterium]